MDRPAPRADQTPTIPNHRRSYCRRDGWLCNADARCDEHVETRDPDRLAELLDRAW